MYVKFACRIQATERANDDSDDDTQSRGSRADRPVSKSQTGVESEGLWISCTRHLSVADRPREACDLSNGNSRGTARSTSGENEWRSSPPPHRRDRLASPPARRPHASSGHRTSGSRQVPMPLVKGYDLRVRSRGDRHMFSAVRGRSCEASPEAITHDPSGSLGCLARRCPSSGMQSGRPARLV